MKKKILSLVVLVSLFVNPFSFTFAKTKIIYERSQDLALKYIENSLQDDNWKDNNPRISGKGKYFYTDDEKNPSYIEFKISCDKTPDCGFILVNADGDDVAIPMASTTGSGPSEALLGKNRGNIENSKLYYFSPFEQYVENIVSGDVNSIDPTDNIEPLLEFDTKLTDELKNKKRQEHKIELKNRLTKGKNDSRDYKKTKEFKDTKEKIKDQILTVPKEEFVMKNLNTANAEYVNPGASNVFVPTSDLQSYSTCSGRTPCYAQFQTTYNGVPCANGCAPTAIGILYGYYDKNGFPNLLYGTAPVTNTTTTNDMMKSVASLMGTFCSGTSGSTYPSNISYAKGYAISKGYMNTTSTFSGTIPTSTIFTETKNEINSGRPIIINMLHNTTLVGHTVVGFGYRNVTTSKVVRMNMGWGGTSVIDSGSSYYTSNIDQNLDAIYYRNETYPNGSNNRIAKSVVKFRILN